MYNFLQSVLYREKSPLKSWLLAVGSSLILLCIFVPVTIIRDIATLFVRKDTFRGVESLLWLVNRSYLKFDDVGIGFDIGQVLSGNARKDLLNSRFLLDHDVKGVHKGLLILSALGENIESQFWLGEFQRHFKGFREKAEAIKLTRQPAPVRKRLIKESDAIAALTDFASLYQGLPGDFFLVSGTFLGVVRENAFLGHDYDIDLGCFDMDFDLKLFLEAISDSRNFYLKEVSYYLDKPENSDPPRRSAQPLVVKLLHSSYVTIDFFIHFEEEGKYVHGSSIHLWSNNIFQLKHYMFYNQACLGPEDFDCYLTENYGDWELEKKDFDCDFDTPNLKFPVTPYTYLYFLEKYSS